MISWIFAFSILHLDKASKTKWRTGFSFIVDMGEPGGMGREIQTEIVAAGGSFERRPFRLCYFVGAVLAN